MHMLTAAHEERAVGFRVVCLSTFFYGKGRQKEGARNWNQLNTWHSDVRMICSGGMSKDTPSLTYLEGLHTTFRSTLMV